MKIFFQNFSKIENILFLISVFWGHMWKYSTINPVPVPEALITPHSAWGSHAVPRIQPWFTTCKASASQYYLSGPEKKKVSILNNEIVQMVQQIFIYSLGFLMLTFNHVCFIFYIHSSSALLPLFLSLSYLHSIPAPSLSGSFPNTHLFSKPLESKLQILQYLFSENILLHDKSIINIRVEPLSLLQNLCILHLIILLIIFMAKRMCACVFIFWSRIACCNLFSSLVFVYISAFLKEYDWLIL